MIIVCVYVVLPQVNNTSYDWHLKAELTGADFSGPDDLVAPAMTTTSYPVLFHPTYQGESMVRFIIASIRLSVEFHGFSHSQLRASNCGTEACFRQANLFSPR